MRRRTGKEPKQIFGECSYFFADQPSEGGLPPLWLRWRLKVLGVVYDACLNWIPKRADMIDVEIEAYLDQAPQLSRGKIGPPAPGR